MVDFNEFLADHHIHVYSPKETLQKNSRMKDLCRISEFLNYKAFIRPLVESSKGPDYLYNSETSKTLKKRDIKSLNKKGNMKTSIIDIEPPYVAQHWLSAPYFLFARVSEPSKDLSKCEAIECIL